MEDTKSLLMMVLHKIFQNKPETIESTFQIIHNFNNGKIEKNLYENTLKSICQLMNNKLPSPILIYLLTLVDIPPLSEPQTSLIEKMRQTHDCLPEINIRPHLLEYLNTAKISDKNENQEKSKIEKPLSKKLVKRRRRNKKTTNPNTTTTTTTTTSSSTPVISTPKALQDLCAFYVIKNENKLENIYKRKLTKAWKIINNGILNGNKLDECYNVIRYLNKKIKLLREIKNNEITSDIIIQDPDVFLKEKHKFIDIQQDILTENLHLAIQNFVK